VVGGSLAVRYSGKHWASVNLEKQAFWCHSLIVGYSCPPWMGSLAFLLFNGEVGALLLLGTMGNTAFLFLREAGLLAPIEWQITSQWKSWIAAL
jgi:hypothetical protein